MNKKAIPNSIVNIDCWIYDTEIWESRKIKKRVVADKNGFYHIILNKSEAVHITVNSDNYEVETKSITIKQRKNEINFYLTPRGGGSIIK